MTNQSVLRIAATITGCCITFLSCTSVPLPSSDSTPPSLTWTIQNETTGDSTTISGSGTINATANDTFRIFLKADDPQGVGSIALSGGYVTSCQAGGAASNASAAFGAQSEASTPDASGHVPASMFLIQNVAGDTTCPGGTSWQSTTVTLHGVGRNLFSGSTEGSLSIHFAP